MKPPPDIININSKMLQSIRLQVYIFKNDNARTGKSYQLVLLPIDAVIANWAFSVVVYCESWGTQAS